jgi:hypothetical protein
LNKSGSEGGRLESAHALSCATGEKSGADTWYPKRHSLDQLIVIGSTVIEVIFE